MLSDLGSGPAQTGGMSWTWDSPLPRTLGTRRAARSCPHLAHPGNLGTWSRAWQVVGVSH